MFAAHRSLPMQIDPDELPAVILVAWSLLDLVK
jgi:hypothetical protein